MSTQVESSANGICRQFLNEFRNAHLQIGDLLQELQQAPAVSPSNEPLEIDAHILPIARLQIFAGLAGALGLAMANDAEATQDPLSIQKQVCPNPNRDLWKKNTQDLQKSLNQTVAATMGIPGLSQIDKIENALEKQIVVKERWDAKLGWTRFAIMAALSIFIWEMAPAVAQALLPGATITGLGAFAARTGGLAIEGLAFQGADNFIFFPEDYALSDRRPLMNWGDFLNSVSQILSSRVNSPKMYFDSLWEFYGSLESKLLQALGPYEDQIEEAEQEGHLQER